MKIPSAFLAGALCAVAVLNGTCGAQPSESRPVAHLFVAGDSTASQFDSGNLQGWATVLQPFFAEDKLRVVNAAHSGSSSRTFITEGYWDRLLASVKPGDFVIIQFGLNDARPFKAEPGSEHPSAARGSLPGVGDESEDIDNAVTGKRETVRTFGWYLRKMIADSRARGATPILLTTTTPNAWSGRGILCTSQTHRLWTHQTAARESVALVDLKRITADRYQRIGAAVVAGQFADKMHTNLAGAEANAADVVAGLRTLQGLPFESMLSVRGRAVPKDPGRVEGSRCAAL